MDSSTHPALSCPLSDRGSPIKSRCPEQTDQSTHIRNSIHLPSPAKREKVASGRMRAIHLSIHLTNTNIRTILFLKHQPYNQNYVCLII